MIEDTKQGAEKSLMKEMGITEQEIAKRSAFLELSNQDVQELLSIDKLAQDYATPVIEAFYQHLLSFDETKVFFQDTELLERVKRL